MKTVRTTATVSDDGVLTVRVPVDLAPGEHEAVVVVEESARAEQEASPLPLHVFELTAWPPDARFSREEIYDHDGR